MERKEKPKNGRKFEIITLNTQPIENFLLNASYWVSKLVC